MMALHRFILCLSTTFGLADSSLKAKPPITHQTVETWESLAGPPKISDDGRFALYAVRHGPVNDWMIAAVNASWGKRISDAHVAEFYSNSRKTVALTSQGTLMLVALGSASVVEIPHVKSFKISADAARRWLAYQPDAAGAQLIVEDAMTEGERRLTGVVDYVFNEQGTVLLYQLAKESGPAAYQELHWVEMDNWRDTVIWRGATAGQFAFDITGSRLAFRAGSNSSHSPEKGLIFYSEKGSQARILIAADDLGSEKSQLMDWSEFKFGDEGSRLLVTAKVAFPSNAASDGVKVSIWNYKESLEQDQQMTAAQAEQSGRHFVYAASILGEHKIVQLAREGEEVFSVRGDFALVRTRRGDTNQAFWDANAQQSTYLVSLADGSRTLLKEDVTGHQPGPFSFSPRGKFVLSGDPARGVYMVYDIAAHAWRELPGQSGIDWSVGHGARYQENSLREAAAWLESEKAVLVYDEFDLWKLDLTGERPPLNLTNGFGRKHHLLLRLQPSVDPWSSREVPTLTSHPRGGCLLNAYDQDSQERGFFRLNGFEGEEPQRLSMGAFGYNSDLLFTPIRSRNSGDYLVVRESTTDSPNVFLTSDFKNFQRVSDVAPEKTFNWMTSEIVSWQTFDGDLGRGILYKPEDFDPHKKYPVVVYFYNWISSDVNKFVADRGNGAYEPLSWLVSNGYLVFYPEIRYKADRAFGASAYDFVISGAKFIAARPWVDPKRMAMMGHSWGAMEANYLLTRNDLFAAAYSGSGDCEYVSAYGYGTDENGANSGPMFAAEVGSEGFGAAPWIAPQLYVDNSALFFVNRVTTPLLLMANQGDSRIPWYQGREFFRALRRAGKKVWMLQYDHGRHGVEGEDALDLSLRIGQFFDHYLKGAPPPKWMTQGVPARLKGADAGLEWDTSGQVP